MREAANIRVDDLCRRFGDLCDAGANARPSLQVQLLCAGGGIPYLARDPVEQRLGRLQLHVGVSESLLKHPRFGEGLRAEDGALSADCERLGPP